MNEFVLGGFGSRRKRNLNLSGSKSNPVSESEDSLGIEWNAEQEQQMRAARTEPANAASRDVVKVGMLPEQTNFQKDYSKLTIYLENNLLRTVKELKKQRRIESYSRLINDALVQYLSSVQAKK